MKCVHYTKSAARRGLGAGQTTHAWSIRTWGIRASSCSALLVLLLSFSDSFAAQGLTVREILGKTLEIEREKAKAERAKADKARFELIQHTLDLRRQQQADAGNERKLIEKTIAEIRLINESRDYVLGSFEAEKRGLVPRLQEANRRFARLAKNRDQWTNKFTRFPEASRGAIWSGRALNHFAELCGTTASEHEFLRGQLAKERQQYEALLQASTGKDKVEAEQQLERIRLQQELLGNIRSLPILNDYHRSKIRYKGGMAKDAATYSAGQGMLPINWGSLLALPGGDFGRHRENIEHWKEKAALQLREHGAVDAETMETVMNLVERLASDMEKYRQRFMHGDLVHYKNQLNSTTLYRDALPMVKQLKIDVLRFLSATRPEDIMFGDDFAGDTIDELMIHMIRNGLQFAPAQANERRTYEVLYREMVRYYMALHSLVVALNYDKGQIKKLEDREQKLLELQYEDTLTRTDRLLRSAPPKSMAESILTGLQLLNEGTTLVGKLIGRNGT
ncbi:MAG: hypothetical protein H8E44_29735 [Planctomycetes bacterium]|nr:hypothetical protein [Planctomycetota bacterium]